MTPDEMMAQAMKMKRDKEIQKVVNAMTKVHADIAIDMSEAYEVTRDRFYRDVFRTISDDFPETKLDEVNMTKEEIGELMVKIAKTRIYGKHEEKFQ